MWREHTKRPKTTFNSLTFIQFETADKEINTTITTQNNATNPDNDQVPSTERNKAVATIVDVRMPEVSAQLRMTSAIVVEEQDTGEKCA